MTWKKTAVLGKDEDWNILLPCLRRSTVQSLNEVDHSDVTEKPDAAEDDVLIGFSSFLTRGSVNTRLPFYRNCPFKYRTQQ